MSKADRSTLPEIEKKKFLVPKCMPCGEFSATISQHVRGAANGTKTPLSAEQTIYLFLTDSKKILKYGQTVGQAWDELRSEDGFLRMSYTSENTLG